MNKDMTVPCDDGMINLRVGAIIMKNGKILMVGNNERPEYLYSVGGRIKFGETSEDAVVREVLEETGYKLEIDRLGFVHENYFTGDAPANLGKLIYEISYFYYMKVPEDFDPVCRSVTEDDKDEFLRWIDVDAPVKYYPEFFRTELLHKTDGIKHFITDGRRHIVVLPYDEKWKQDFIQIRNELSAALGSLAVRIEHVGSTSVPGLSAKPIIDIDVVIRDYSVFEDVVSALGKIGYVHEGDKGIPAREVFGYEGKEHLREHHLYVCPEDSAELKRHTSFRDYLRSHPGAVQEYSRVKEEGAVLHPHDIDSYIEHKSPFIEKIYAKISV